MNKVKRTGAFLLLLVTLFSFCFNAFATSKSDTTTTSGTDIVNTFIAKTSFIEKSSEYTIFIGGWAGAAYKEQYLDIKGNTEAMWYNMTPYQRACYSLLCLYPQSIIQGENQSVYAKDHDTWIENLDVVKTSLDNLPRGDEVYNAVVTVWEWHWHNWESKPTFINPFASHTILDSSKSESKDSPNDDMDTLDSQEIANRKQLSSPSTLLDILKENIISVILIVGLGTALLVIFYKKKKKNSDF